MSEYPAGPEDANKIPIYRSRIVLGTIGWFIGVISVLNPIVKITRTMPLLHQPFYADCRCFQQVATILKPGDVALNCMTSTM